MELALYLMMGLSVGFALLWNAFLCALWFYFEIGHLRQRVVWLEERLEREQQQRRSPAPSELSAGGCRCGKVGVEYGGGRR